MKHAKSLYQFTIPRAQLNLSPSKQSTVITREPDDLNHLVSNRNLRSQAIGANNSRFVVQPIESEYMRGSEDGSVLHSGYPRQ